MIVAHPAATAMHMMFVVLVEGLSFLCNTTCWFHHNSVVAPRYWRRVNLRGVAGCAFTVCGITVSGILRCGVSGSWLVVVPVCDITVCGVTVCGGTACRATSSAVTVCGVTACGTSLSRPAVSKLTSRIKWNMCLLGTTSLADTG
jgi:hypothetical protein